jgi:hypothetical protein
MTDLDTGADLRERIDRALTDLHAPDGLTEAALSGGHRLRRRRRVLAGASGLAAAAVVTALLVVADLGGGTASTQPDVATQPPASPSASQEPSGADTPSPGPDVTTNALPDAPEGWWDAPADRLLDQLRSALPNGVDITAHELAPKDRAPGDPKVSAGWLHATLATSQGPGGFEIILYPPDPTGVTEGYGQPSHRSQTRCGRQAAYADTCEVIRDTDGVVIGRVTNHVQYGVTTFHEVSLLGPDGGGRIHIAAWNATDGKPGPGTAPSAEMPPLTLDQLRELALDPAWTSYRP